MTNATNDAPNILEMPFADKVRVSHVPPLDADGPVDGAALSAVAKAEVEAMERAFSSPPERTQETSVDGPFVSTRSTVRGVLKDGTNIDYRTEVVLEIENGKVVAMQAHIDAESATQHRKALEMGNFKRPTPTN